MVRRPRVPILAIPLLLAAVAGLTACQTDRAGSVPPAQQAAAASPAPAGQPSARAPAAAAQPEPAGPITEQQASAACWMKYERGRRDLPLDARMKLVDECIDARLKAGR
jgi:hypothetical protein